MKMFPAKLKFGWVSASLCLVVLLAVQEYVQSLPSPGINSSNFLVDIVRDLKFGRDFDRASMSLTRGYSGDFRRLSSDVQRRFARDGYAVDSSGAHLARTFITGLAQQGAMASSYADDSTGDTRAQYLDEAAQSYRTALTFLPDIPDDIPSGTPQASPTPQPSSKETPESTPAPQNNNSIASATKPGDSEPKIGKKEEFLRSLGEETLNGLGYFLADRGENLQDWQQAEQLTALAVQLSPSTTKEDRLNRAIGPQDSHAWALYRLGKLSEARLAQSEVIATIGELAPSKSPSNLNSPNTEASVPAGLSPDIPFHMGAIYKALGQSKKADRFFNIAKTLGASDDLSAQIDLMQKGNAT